MQYFSTKKYIFMCNMTLYIGEKNDIISLKFGSIVFALSEFDQG